MKEGVVQIFNSMRLTNPALGVAGLVVLAAAYWTLSVWLRPSVTTVLPIRGSAAEVVYATGVIEPVYWAKVVALARKRIIEICHCEGEAVRRGDILAQLDDLEERAQLRELEARLKRLKEDADRMQGLVERNVASRVSYDEKLTQIVEYEARMTAQKERINDLQLRAPMDGIVLRRDGEVGEVAGIGVSDVLFWVGKPRPLRVVAEVNEDDIPRVRKGQRVLLRHDGLPGQDLTATVADITPKGDPSTKTFRVYFGLPDDTPLRIGMGVEANVIVREVQQALLVPAEALSASRLSVVANGSLQHRTVGIGVRGTRLFEITSGLKDGEQVVSPARADLADATRVNSSEVVNSGRAK